MGINNLNKVHFTGIGGISMSSLADILLYRGVKVTGSDTKESELTRKLEEKGAEIFIGQRSENVPEDADILVYTAAVKADNPELVRAGELGIKLFTRAGFLGNLMKDYKNVICVSGTHGKTTTTSMTAQILMDCGADPTVLNGGIMPSINSQTRIGSEDIMVAEACEYTNSFHSFFPTVGIILNVRPDHLDFFKDIDDIRQSFRKFASLIPAGGSLIISDSIDDKAYFFEGQPFKVITFGLDPASDYCAKNIEYDDFSRGSYDLYEYGRPAGRITLGITGEHGITDSLAAIAAARLMGAGFDEIRSSLRGFTGAKRRFEIKGSVGGLTIIDDYAHHPDEISATLSAAKGYPHKKLLVVFQPHTFSRTAALLDDFARALSAADEVILTDIYAAREKNTFGITSDDLRKKVEEYGAKCTYCPSFDMAENFILENCGAGDVLITMGAGDVVNIGESLLGGRL